MTLTEFNDLVSTQSRKLYGYAFNILRNQEEAEDAVQEVFIKLWKLGRKTEEYNSIDALIITMTKNHCLDQLRKRKYIDAENQNEYDLTGETISSLYEAIERKETSDILHAIIAQLPENCRTIIRLREIDGFSYEEIAKITNLNINNLRVILSRARKIIKKEYLKYKDE